MARDAPVGDLHIVPPAEEDHVPDAECYCCPRLEHEDRATGRRVWVHHERGEAN